jgi:hypothetical protein
MEFKKENDSILTEELNNKYKFANQEMSEIGIYERKITKL